MGYFLVLVQLVISVIALGGVLSACEIGVWWVKWGGRFVYWVILGSVGCVLGGLVWGFMGGEKRDEEKGRSWDREEEKNREKGDVRVTDGNLGSVTRDG